MSITDELRHNIEGAEQLYGCECKHLLAIADRIDAEHESACAEAYGNGVMSVPIALDENAWVELPKDADGECIHVGDVMELVSYDEDYRPVIRPVDAVGEQVFFAWSDEQGRYAQYEAHAYRHHHAPTVEDVLREFTDAILEWSGKSGTVAEVGTWSDVAAEYATKLKLAERGDA